MEEVKQSRSYTKEEELCEEHFVSKGRFIVQLPLKGKILELGDSRDIAERRLRAIERKLDKNPTLKTAYVKFLQEYESLGHMSKVEEHEKNDEHANYLPHHAVTKSTSTRYGWYSMQNFIRQIAQRHIACRTDHSEYII